VAFETELKSRPLGNGLRTILLQIPVAPSSTAYLRVCGLRDGRAQSHEYELPERGMANATASRS
jgi:hypothetical protein